MTPASTATKWKWCLVTSLAMVLLSMVPQIHLWIVRGRDWNGAYVSPQGDEIYYSGYINALINGRPRKNDPFGGRDDSPSAPLPESTFSIQFIPAYAIAIPSRVFHLSASSAFIIVTAIAAFLASLSVFRLLETVTADRRTATAGTLFVLCLGWVVGRYGIFNTYFDIGIPALHFLRRYQPAVAFPSFFFFQLLVWRSLTSQDARRRIWLSLSAGLILASLIFSYLYLWTAAAAWLACLGFLWLCSRRHELSKIVTVLAIISLTTGFPLLAYLHLIALRSPTLDQQQTFIATRLPDPWRAHELVGTAIIVALIVGIRKGSLAWAQPQVQYTASLAILPFIVFNQQVVTGRTIQPFHFEIFVVNYSSLIACVILVRLFWSGLSTRFLLWVSVTSFCIGLLAVGLPGRLVSVPAAIESDKGVPVLRRLSQLSLEDGTLFDLRNNGTASTLVFSPSVPLMALLPTWTVQGTLIDVGGLDFGSTTFEQRKLFLYMHLYYSNVNPEVLRDALRETTSRQPKELASFRSMIFGHERTIPALNPEFRAVRTDEVEAEVQKYQAFVSAFSHEEALKRPITYAVIPADGTFDFSNLDRWYERDAGERWGDYVLYRLKLKP
jgi:hypothetical protein